jgi:hypothetical protein
MSFLMRAAVVVAGVLGACSSGARSAQPVASTESDHTVERERIERAAIVSRHRALESEQQDALGATCTDEAKWESQHCTPACYPAEPSSARAGTKLAGAVEIEHEACRRDGGAWMILDDGLGGRALAIRSYRKHPPKPHKAGSWQAAIEESLPEKYVVTGAAMRPLKHGVTNEPMQCVKVAQYATLHATLGICGIPGDVTCEAAGNPAARALNLVRYRLAEAMALHSEGKEADCQAASLDALATVRGMPRWRQYAKLNVGEWKDGILYKTRFDGVLDEDALFALAASLGSDAERLHTTCGGAAGVKTTPQQEQAFHSCP